MTQADGAGMPGPSAFWSALLFIGLALAIMAPELVSGTSYSASFRYNVVWPEEIVSAMRNGLVYPRWLSGSWDGLGAPTFYFYPPLFFLTAGSIAWIGAGGLSVSAATSLASAAFLALSGVTMRLWLRDHVSPRLALIGAILWMVAPYRIMDIYARGALAEATIYATLPLLMWGLTRIGQGERHHIATVSVGYTLMLVGHLPVTLLASLTVIPAYALWSLREGQGAPAGRLAAALGGGILGLLIAAFFLIPSLTLLSHVSADQLFTDFFSPESWFFFSGPGSILGPSVDDGQFTVVALASGYVLLALAALPAIRSRPGLGLWLGLALVCFLMASGLIAPVWRLPFLSQVQFPSRMLVISEFVAVTLLALAWGRASSIGLALAGLPVIIGALLVLRMAHERVSMSLARGATDRAIVMEQRREAPEYLPAGFPIAVDAEGRADPSAISLPERPEVSAEDRNARISGVVRLVEGGFRFSIAASEKTRVTVRRFAFPGWVVERTGSPASIAVEPANGLVRWPVEPGSHEYHLRRGPVPYERSSALVSILALLTAIGLGRYFVRGSTRLTRSL